MTTYTGDSGNNRLTGIKGVKDEFVGLQGSDKLRGNGANDHDVVNYSFDAEHGATRGVKVNLWAGGSQGGIAADSAFDSFGFKDSVRGIPDVIGTQYADIIYGGGHANALSGGAGNDLVSGYRGKDTIDGGLGKDKLYGGTEADTFVFTTTKDSTVAATGRDTIFDFSHAQHDRIKLSGIDANTNAGGNQSFTFIGDAAFHHKAGELRYAQSGGTTLVYGDVNGDGKADFAIALKGTLALIKGDFFL